MSSQMQVSLVDSMGDDLSVVNAARVSMHKESELSYVEDRFDPVLKDSDAKLITYLAKHKHWTPFAHTAISVRVKAPIFVARQLGKHQVGLVWNEVSRRYVSDPPEFYTPKEWRLRADNVKQGSSETEFIHDQGAHLAFEGLDFNDIGLHIYTNLLEQGICPEQARMVLPQSMMTEWIWTGNLVSFSNMCKLRLDPHTQKETREVAQMIADVIQPLYPVSWKELLSV